MKDKNGKEITIGSTVIVPEPSLKDDYWDHEFQATVHCFRDGGLVCVEDQDENGWDVEPERLEVISSPSFVIDIPDPFNLESSWINIGNFDDKDKALEFVKKTFGADDEGRISLISEVTND